MNNSTSTTSSLVIEWTALLTSEAGYADASSYNLYWDAGTAGASYVSLVGETSASLLTTYTVSTLVTEGNDYLFKVRAKNVHGWGDFSTVATVTASSVPGTPSAASTAFDSNGDIVVTFSAPTFNGQDISAYLIWFADEAETTYLNAVGCDGWSDTTILSGLTCTVAMSTLTGATHLIAQGDIVKVQVQAYNVRGWGALSTANISGATAKTVPTQMVLPTRGSGTSTTQL